MSRADEAGRRRISRRQLVGLGIGGAIAVAGAGALATLARGKRPNVIFIVWDTARADRMSLYGYRRPTTPRIDAWAERAAVFERARSPGIWTLPSHASMFTGLPPHTHGAEERWLWLDQRFSTLAEHFAAHGYATFSMAANSLLCNETNLVKGFGLVLNTYAAPFAKQAEAMTRRKVPLGDRSHELAPDWRPPAHNAHNAEWARAVYKEAAPLVVRTFGRWLLRQPREQPFFAFLNLMEAHTPRIPSMASRQRVLADDPALIPLGLTTDAAHIQLHFYNFGKHDYTDAELAAINGVYDATLADLDDATGELLDQLSARGYLDDTIVVLTADHGENLGDHHLFNHRFCLWDTLMHVPLVIWGPEIAPGRVTHPVSTTSLFATLSRQAGLRVPRGIVADDLFSPGAAPVTALSMPLLREIDSVRGVYPEVDPAPWLREGHAVVDGDHKLIRTRNAAGEQLQLYDLAADPGELHPLDEPERAAAMAAHLDAWLAQWPAYDPSERGPQDQPDHVRASQEDLQKQLEAMGYVTSEEGEREDPR